MQKKIILSLVVLAFCLTAQPGFAKVFQSIDKTFRTETTPLDVTSSADGKYTFVLTANGTLKIYEESGENEDISVGQGFDRISASATGDKIWLINPKDKKVQGVYLDFVKNIETDGSPFLGAETAPVVLAVFSDFQ